MCAWLCRKWKRLQSSQKSKRLSIIDQILRVFQRNCGNWGLTIARKTAADLYEYGFGNKLMFGD